jgi:hypothetical protein
MRPEGILLCGLRTYCYEAIRHTAMRPAEILL